LPQMGDELVVHGGDLVGLLSQSPSRWMIAHYSRSARSATGSGAEVSSMRSGSLASFNELIPQFHDRFRVLWCWRSLLLKFA
jgi:hypothetical protein